MARNRIFHSFAGCKPGWGGIWALVFWLIAGALAGNAVTLVFARYMGAEASRQYAMLLSYPVMFLPAMWWAYRNSANSRDASPVELDRSNFAPFGFPALCVLAAVSTLSLGFLTDYLTSLLPALPEWLKTALESMTGGNIWLNILCAGIMAPFFEEWLCRGMVLRGLLSKGYRPFWAILVSAAFFAVIHLNPWQAIPAFAVGLLMGYIYWKTGSLKLTMLMHGVNNVFAVICSHVPAWKDMETWRDVIPAEIYWIIFISCAILLILCCRKFRRIESI